MLLEPQRERDFLSPYQWGSKKFTQKKPDSRASQKHRKTRGFPRPGPKKHRNTRAFPRWGTRQHRKTCSFNGFARPKAAFRKGWRAKTRVLTRPAGEKHVKTHEIPGRNQRSGACSAAFTSVLARKTVETACFTMFS